MSDGFHAPDLGSKATLSSWNDLASRLKKSRSIDRQLALLFDNAENRNSAKKFRGKDAAIVINTIDKVLEHNQVPDETKSRAFELLRQLAGASCQVPKRYLIGTWTIYTVKKDPIASGGFADIREGKLGKKVVAVKTIRISRDKLEKLGDIHKAFCKESVLWMYTSHPNILRLLAVEVKPQAHKFSMVSELMTNGNITNYIRVNKANRLRLLKDVANGLQYLHGLRIIHGDLKGANILINNETPGRACLADFGLCSIVPIMSSDPTTRGEAGGTFGYMAPELYQVGAKPSKPADIYAFGMVVYEVITGTRLFGQHILLQLPTLTTQGWRPPRPEGPVAMFDQGTWEFVERCWNENSEQRPTAEEALGHFDRVVVNSTVVDPGPIPSARGAVVEAPSVPSSSIIFPGLLAHQQINGSNRFQQASFTARTFVNPGGVRPPVPVPPKPDLLDRVRRGVKSLTPKFLLPSSARDET